MKLMRERNQDWKSSSEGVGQRPKPVLRHGNFRSIDQQLAVGFSKLR